MTALRTLTCGLLLLMLTAPAWAQPTVAVQPESRFWIEGQSSVNQFTCRVTSVHGQGQLDAPGDSATTHESATVQVPVQTFDCGKRRMTNDLQEALRAEAHPTIRYELRAAELAATDSTAGWHRIRALGTLTIAGTARPVELTAYGRAIDAHTYRLCGRRTLKMSDFGIEPPTKLLGLIRVHDEIEVHFDLIAAPSTRPEAATAGLPPSPTDISNTSCEV